MSCKVVDPSLQLSSYVDRESEFGDLVRSLLHREKVGNRRAYAAILTHLRVADGAVDRDELARVWSAEDGRDPAALARQIPTWMGRLDRLLDDSSFRIEQPMRGRWRLHYAARARALVLFEAPTHESVGILAALKDVDRQMSDGDTGVSIVEAGILMGDKDVFCLVEAEDASSIATVLVRMIEERLRGTDCRTVTYLIPSGLAWRKRA